MDEQIPQKLFIREGKQMEHIENYKTIINNYGESKQKIKAIEEMSELQKELCKDILHKGKKENITEEMADVEIMLNQLKIIFDNEEKVKEIIEEKIKRTKERIKNGQ